MEFIGDDSSSDEEENGEEQQQPPPQKSSSSKPIIIQQQKQPPLPHIKVKKDDVNMKMKLRLLKQYEKRFGKIENSSNTVNISSVKQEQQSVSSNNDDTSTITDNNNNNNSTYVAEKKDNNNTFKNIKTTTSPEWAEAFDAKTGKSYYYNIKSGITSWNVPGEYIPLKTNSKKRDNSMITSKNTDSLHNPRKRARADGNNKKMEQYMNRGKFDNLNGMTTLVQNDVISSVQVDKDNMPTLNTVQEPRIRVQKWNAETGQFVTTSGASRSGKGKNSIQALAAQAYVLQQGLDKNKKKPGKSLKQSRMKYGW